MNYEFHPSAEAEYLKAIAYYESKSPGLGASYLLEFERSIGLVCSSPQQYSTVLQPNIKKKLLERFPFTIFYREVNKVVQILAVAHQKKRPDYWFGRV